MTSDHSVDAHTALLSSRIGQVIVGVVVIAMGVWIVGPNMPAGPMRDTVDVVWLPATETGFEQNWAVFSPNPRAQSLEVFAQLEYADGTTARWTLPDFDPVVGAYRDYRWRKWQERVRLDDYGIHWDPTAEWIARENRRDGDAPITVRLVRRWTDHAPLTLDGVVDDGPNEYVFHVWTSSGD